VAHQLHQFATHHTTPCCRAIIKYLYGLPSGPMGLINMYGPKNYRQCAALWENIAHLTNNQQPWLLGGHFNMTLSASDQIGCTLEDLSGLKASSWQEFTELLGLQEYMPQADHPTKFTRDNHRQNALNSTRSARIFKCLDRSYASAVLASIYPMQP
jgi:hypothetical protein